MLDAIESDNDSPHDVLVLSLSTVDGVFLSLDSSVCSVYPC